MSLDVKFKKRVCPLLVFEKIKKHYKEWGKYPEYAELAYNIGCHSDTIKKRITTLHLDGKIEILSNKNGKYNYVLKNKKVSEN